MRIPAIFAVLFVLGGFSGFFFAKVLAERSVFCYTTYRAYFDGSGFQVDSMKIPCGHPGCEHPAEILTFGKFGCARRFRPGQVVDYEDEPPQIYWHCLFHYDYKKYHQQKIDQINGV